MGMSEAGGWTKGPSSILEVDPLALWTTPISCLSLHRSLSSAFLSSRSCFVQPSGLRNAISAPAPCCVLPLMSAWSSQSSATTARQLDHGMVREESSGGGKVSNGFNGLNGLSVRVCPFGDSVDFVDFKAARRFAISRFERCSPDFVLSCK